MPLPRPVLTSLGTIALFALACGRGPSSSAVQPAAPGSASAAPQPREAEYAATEILLSHVGAAGAEPGTTRTEPEARTLATQLWLRATAGESLEALAKEHSDGSEGPRGGRLGVYRTGTMVPEFERAVASVAVGALAQPFRTPFGWHVARRDAVVEITARQILITWSGARKSAATRTRAEAKTRADAVLARLNGGEDFAKVAKELSDDASATVGGDLGPIAPGQLVPDFEDAAFALDVGQRSAVVESPYGFHIIERTR